MKLVEIISPESICTDLESSGKMAVLGELSIYLSKMCPEVNAEKIIKALVERERLATTGIGEGVAIPHGKVEGLDRICAAVGISRTGIPFDTVDGQPVHIFVALLAPPSASGDHLHALARISRLLRDPGFRERLIEARTEDAAFSVIKDEDGKY